MISKIVGILESIDPSPPGSVALRLGESGLTVEVLLPRYLGDRLAAQPERIGRPIEFFTRLDLESVGQGSSFVPRLIGFATPPERAFFVLLTGVKGLGAKRALRALAAEPSAIAGWIAAKDAKALQKLPEIGKRLAETILVDLSGKVDGFLGEGELARLDAAALAEAKPLSPAVESALETLVALGETRSDAARKIDRILGAHPDLTTGDADAIVAAVFGG